MTNQQVGGSTVFGTQASGGAESVPVPPDLAQWKDTMVDIAKRVAADSTLTNWGDRANAVKTELSKTAMTQDEQNRAFPVTMAMTRAELCGSGGGADDRRGMSLSLMASLDASSGSLWGKQGGELQSGLNGVLNQLDVHGPVRKTAKDYLADKVSYDASVGAHGGVNLTPSSAGSNTGIVGGSRPATKLPLSPKLEQHRGVLEGIADKLSRDRRSSQGPHLYKALSSELKQLQLGDAQRQEARRLLLDALTRRHDRLTE